MPLKLSTFSANQKITTPEGNATGPFLRWINDAVKSIQSSVNDIGQLVADIAFSLQQAGIAITTANEAKAAALSNARGQALVNSYVSPSDAITTGVDPSDPTKAFIAISEHSRIYGDQTVVGVMGATLSGLLLYTQYYIVYSDPARAGGGVSYTATPNANLAGQSGDQHLVGGIVTPSADGTGGGDGGTTTPPGVPGWKFQDRRVDEQ